MQENCPEQLTSILYLHHLTTLKHEDILTLQVPHNFKFYEHDEITIHNIDEAIGTCEFCNYTELSDILFNARDLPLDHFPDSQTKTKLQLVHRLQMVSILKDHQTV
jgi:hypothetical protein